MGKIMKMRMKMEKMRREDEDGRIVIFKFKFFRLLV